MVFGKYINRYYLKYAALLLAGLAALIAVDYLQLEIPGLYQMVINGVNQGFVVQNGVQVPFTMDFLLDKICKPLVILILCIVFCRFAWRVTIFGAATKMEQDLRDRMFDRCRHLSQDYYQVNKVGNLMSLFTNDLDTVQECFGWGFLQVFDAAFLGGLAVYRMVKNGPHADPAVPDPHGTAVCGCVHRRAGHDKKVGLPAGVLLQAVRFCSGKLLRYCGHQGICEGNKRTAGLPGAEPGK